MAPKPTTRSANAPRQAETSSGKRVLHVFPEDAEAEDAVLLCASGRKVVTTAALLEMLSPSVLRGAVEAARQQGGVAGSSSSSSSSSGGASKRKAAPSSAENRIEIQCGDDSADVWLRCLQLKHPGIASDAGSTFSWADLCSMLRLADKYSMVSVLRTCESLLLATLRTPGTGSPQQDVEGLAEGIKMARLVNLNKLETACWEAAEQLVTPVWTNHGYGMQNVVHESVVAKLAESYMLREQLPDGTKGPKKASAGDDNACIIVTLLMARLAAAEALLRNMGYSC